MNTYTKTPGGPLWGAQKSTNRGETSTNRMSFRRISESSFCALSESGWARVAPAFRPASLALPRIKESLRRLRASATACGSEVPK
jgi:hypothetical protein